MGKHGSQMREKNPFWKGGRVIASNGYVLVRVGVSHHLSDVRGYAYEHRLMAEQKIGRMLVSGELVHHVNGDKTDNRIENLNVVPSIAHHWAEHRKPGNKRRLPGEINTLALCECGCRTLFRLYDSGGRPRKFVSGHNLKRAA